MNKSLLEIIVLGRKYLKLWPEHYDLIHYFAEYRQIEIGRFVCKYSALFAAFVFTLPVAFDSRMLSQSVFVSAIFLLSMPVQVYIMLGLQADKYLPPSLAKWYKEGVSRVENNNVGVKLTLHKPRYFDLVQLLNLSYQTSSK